MNVNVKEADRDHFWEEPPEDTEEFWAFRFKPKCEVGDQIVFCFDRRPVARAVVSRIEKPGQTSCASTGRFKHLWKVFWSQESFEDLRGAA